MTNTMIELPAGSVAVPVAAKEIGIHTFSCPLRVDSVEKAFGRGLKTASLSKLPRRQSSPSIDFDLLPQFFN